MESSIKSKENINNYEIDQKLFNLQICVFIVTFVYKLHSNFFLEFVKTFI